MLLQGISLPSPLGEGLGVRLFPLGEGLGVRLFISFLVLFSLIFTNFAIAFRPLRRSVCGQCVLDN